jgi:hypothetical protein
MNDDDDGKQHHLGSNTSNNFKSIEQIPFTHVCALLNAFKTGSKEISKPKYAEKCLGKFDEKYIKPVQSRDNAFSLWRLLCPQVSRVRFGSIDLWVLCAHSIVLN